MSKILKLDIDQLPDCHAVTLSDKDAVALDAYIQDWLEGRYFNNNEPEEQWKTAGKRVHGMIDKIVAREDLPVLTSNHAGELGRLLTYMRKEYSGSYKDITAKGALAHLKTSFMDAYREINRLIRHYYQPLAHKRFAQELKEEQA